MGSPPEPEIEYAPLWSKIYAKVVDSFVLGVVTGTITRLPANRGGGFSADFSVSG